MAKTKNIKPFDEQDTRLAMGQDAGEYNPDIHGLPVPLVNKKQRSKLQIA